MNQIDIIDHHMVIKETIGYKPLESLDEITISQIFPFLKIVYNYQRMGRFMRKDLETSGIFRIFTENKR